MGEGLVGYVAAQARPDPPLRAWTSSCATAAPSAAASRWRATHPRSRAEIPLPGLPDARKPARAPARRARTGCSASSRSRAATRSRAPSGTRRSCGPREPDRDRASTASRRPTRSRRPAEPLPGARTRRGTDALIRILPERRLRLRRRRVPDPQRPREDPLEAARRAREDRPARVHEPRAAPRPVARPARPSRTTSRAGSSCSRSASRSSASACASSRSAAAASPSRSAARSRSSSAKTARPRRRSGSRGIA